MASDPSRTTPLPPEPDLPRRPHDTALERELAYATVVSALAVLVGMAAERLLGFDDLSLVFMTAVIFVAVRTRMGVAVYAAIACFLAYNYFFLEPRYTLYITARHGLATVTMFLVAALACGRLANRLREQVILLQAARAHAQAMHHLGRALAAAGTDEDAIAVARTALRDALDCEPIVLRADEHDGALVEVAPVDMGERFDPTLQAAAARCLARAIPGTTGESPGAEHDLSWHCLPLGAPDRPLGVVALRAPPAQLSPDLVRLAEAMVRELAQALARLQLGRQLATTRLQAETERLRAALLSSVSHDLRSPLSTIIGSAESLDVYRDRLSAEDQVQLARDILGEGLRLDRYIQNLLDMTRLGHGALAPEREWIGIDDVLGAAVRRALRVHPGQRFAVSGPDPSPLLRVNPPLFEQAVFNVLDNAAKFSPAGGEVGVRAGVAGDRAWIEVDDAGPGIPEEDRERVFDLFHRVERGDRRPNGTGLGLTICRGILEAHGGDSTIVPGPGGIGTTVRLSLPLDEPPADAPKDD